MRQKGMATARPGRKGLQRPQFMRWKKHRLKSPDEHSEQSSSHPESESEQPPESEKIEEKVEPSAPEEPSEKPEEPSQPPTPDESHHTEEPSKEVLDRSGMSIQKTSNLLIITPQMRLKHKDDSEWKYPVVKHRSFRQKDTFITKIGQMQAEQVGAQLDDDFASHKTHQGLETEFNLKSGTVEEQ